MKKAIICVWLTFTVCLINELYGTIPSDVFRTITKLSTLGLQEMQTLDLQIAMLLSQNIERILVFGIGRYIWVVSSDST
ncbi:hypothetical protein Leryth_018498 [Lithospermum erythrorhizon]|nr:hypothetical protein Leryth_018498 [Lithospermum erythrorhizon]